jgi:hypothetical protein
MGLNLVGSLSNEIRIATETGDIRDSTACAIVKIVKD